MKKRYSKFCEKILSVHRQIHYPAVLLIGIFIVVLYITIGWEKFF